MVVVETAPLQTLHASSGKKKMVSRVMIGASALLAVATFAAAVMQTGGARSSLIQSFIPTAKSVPMAASAPMQTLASQMPPMAQPVYYVPLAAANGGAQPQQALATNQPRPVVYYYVPENSAKAPESSVKAKHTISLAANATTEEKTEFSCQLANLKTEVAPALAAWDTCKVAKDYKQPNANAKRRLLEWVWEDKQGHVMSLAANSTAATAEGPSLADCEHNATKDVCNSLAGCPDPVCKNYYSDPDIQRICGICTMQISIWGCFARDAPTVVAGRGAITVGELEVGDHVMAAAADGSVVFSRVYYIHDHKDVSATVRISHSAGVLELTPQHMLPVYTGVCGDQYCEDAKLVNAKDVKVGMRVYIAGKDGSSVQTVSGVSEGVSMIVRYVLTEAETIVVGGVVASVRSTAAGPLETLPFRMMDYVFRGSLQFKPVTASLAVVMDSPILKFIEAVLDAALSVPAARMSSMHHMVAPFSSF